MTHLLSHPRTHVIAHAVDMPGGNHRSVAYNGGKQRGEFFQEQDGIYSSTRASTGTFLGSDQFIQTAAIDDDRFNYDPIDSTVGLTGGWMYEAADTNLCLRSEELDDAAWTAVNSTINADVDTAPDGAATMDRIVDDATNGLHGRTQTVTVGNNARQTLSCWADNQSQDFLYMRMVLPSGTQEAWFDLSTGTVGTVNGAFYAQMIGPYRNGRYRCFLHWRNGGADAGVRTLTISAMNVDNSTAYVGSSRDAISVWGVQYEQNNLSSYIPTAGVTVTRSQDLSPILSDLITLDGFRLYCELTLGLNLGIDTQLLTVFDTSAGANGETFSVAKTAADAITLNITDDTGTVRFTTFDSSAVATAYNDLLSVLVDWPNGRTGESRVEMRLNGTRLPFLSTTFLGTEQWSDMPSEFHFNALSRDFTKVVRSFEIQV